jgi:glycosyltransferase involved in cell wall biosynthesis
MFQSVKGLMFNTVAERELAKKLYDLDGAKCAVVSLGFEKGKSAGPALFRKKFKLEDPYILFAGRREKGKNVPLLMECFRAYKRHNQNNLRLVLIGSGPVELLPEDKGNIFDFGYVSEEEKLSATQGALVFCQPSTNESLSIVILQGWLFEVPALVHSHCAVTKAHCDGSNGGLYFKNYFEFEECLNFFLNNPATVKKMGESGRRYVEQFFNWEIVLNRFQAALEKFQAPSSLALQL